MTNEVADWTGNGRRLRSRTSTVNDSTGSTIKIIIVGPMIGSSSVLMLLLLLIVAMIVIVGCFTDMYQSVGCLLGVEEAAGDPFSRNSTHFWKCRS